MLTMRLSVQRALSENIELPAGIGVLRENEEPTGFKVTEMRIKSTEGGDDQWYSF